MYYLRSESKGADQLIGAFVFAYIWTNSGFLMTRLNSFFDSTKALK